MTTWQDVVRQGRSVANGLTQKRRPTVRYENSHGKPVDGWHLGTLGNSRDDTEYYAGTDYRDVYTNNGLVLGNDGVISIFTLLNVEEGRRESDGFRVTTERRLYLHPVDAGTLDPSLNEPMKTVDFMRMLNHLAAKENTDPEPPAPSTKTTSTFSPNAARPTPPAQPRPTPRTNGPAQVHPDYTWGQPKKVDKGSDWTPIIIGAIVVIVLVAIAALIVGLTNNVQFH